MAELSTTYKKKILGQTLNSKQNLNGGAVWRERKKKDDTTARHSNQNNQKWRSLDSPREKKRISTNKITNWKMTVGKNPGHGTM